MLGKLCKHELKATARYFLPLFLITLLLTPVTRVTVSVGNYPGILNFIPAIVVFAYVASILVIAAASVILIIHRFYKSMVTEEGYLMHTLPVSTEMHIFAKLIISSLWVVSSFLVILISLFMMFYTPDRFASLMNEFGTFLSMVRGYANSSQVALIIIEIIILILLGIVTSPLIFYASIAIGQIISKNKVLGSVIGFFIIQFVSQILGMISMVPFGYSMEKLGDTMSTQMAIVSNVFFPYCIIISIISGVVLFVLTDYIFKKKLNLE